jgi:competence protein ComEA
MQPETAQQRRPDPWPFGPVHGSGGPVDPPVARPAVRPAPHEARADADELVARLRARRSTAGVAAAYAAAHGHPADPRAEHGARRWALTGTTALVAVVAVLLLGVGAAAFSMRGDGVETLAPLTADESSADKASAGRPASPFPGGSPGPTPSDPASGAATPGAATAGGGLLVHVVGEVAEPGLVSLPDGARVADAVRAAGGVTRKADLTAVNLARQVVDGEQLYVPEPGEPVPGGPVAPGAGGQGASSDQPVAGGAVDINAADAVALEALPGVGPSIAQAIVEWRETNGPFASVDELEDVPGIGPATLDEFRDSARVGP